MRGNVLWRDCDPPFKLLMRCLVSSGMKTLTITTSLDASPDRDWEALNTPRLFLFVAHPVVRFAAVKPRKLPQCWENGDYVLEMRGFGLLPLGTQVISISRPPSRGDERALLDDGHSTIIRRWRHLMTVAPEGDGTRYTDRIEIDAGVITPVVVVFARLFFAHRQRRWRRVVSSGFNY